MAGLATAGPAVAFGADLCDIGRMLEWIKSVFKSAPAKDPLGERGENVAARYLQRLGYKIITRNFRAPVGEIDIIARDGKTLVFCEVKARESDEPRPEDQVSGEKQHQITKAAKYYLSRFGTPRPAARFDVLAVIWPPRCEPTVRHTQSAFEATF